MNKTVSDELKSLRKELEESHKIIEALKRHQKMARSSTFNGVGAFETMVRLEKMVEHRTSELQGSREELLRAKKNLEKLVAERTHSLEEANKELEVVAAIGRQVSTSLDLNEILNSAMEKILEITRLKGGGIFLVDYENKELISAGGWGLSEEFCSTTSRVKIGVGISGTVAQTGETILVEGLTTSVMLSPKIRDLNRREGLEAQVSVPLKSKDKVVGVMNLVSATGQKIRPQDISVLKAVGNQVGVAVENAMLYQETQKRLQELTSLQNTSALITSTLDLNYLLNTIVKEASAVFKADAISIMLLDESGEFLSIKAAAGLSPEYVDCQLVPYKKAEAQVDGIPTKALIVPNLQDKPFGNPELIKKENLFTCIATPLIKDGNLIGVLNIYSKNEVREFTEHEINLARTFADQATIAILNAMQYKEQVVSKNELKILYDIGQSIVSSLDLDQTLELIVNGISRLIPAFLTSIMLLDKSTNELAVRAGVGHKFEDWKNKRIKVGEGITGIVAKSGKPEIIPDVSLDSRYREVVKEVRSKLCVPLIHMGGVIGVINVASERANAYQQKQLELLSSLANLAAIAIVNASAFEQSEKWSSHLQAVQKLGSDLNIILDVNELANQVVKELKTVIEYDDCRFYLLNDKKEELNAIAQLGSGHYHFNNLEVLKVKVGEGVTGNVAKTGEPELVPNAVVHPYAITIPGTEDVDESMLLSPMIFENKVLGVISLSAVGLNRFSEDHLRLLSIFSDQAAIALENASLYEEKRTQLDEIQRLRDSNEAIVSGLEEGIIIEDIEGNIEFANPKMEEVTGYRTTELFGKQWIEIISHRFHTIANQENAKHYKGLSSRYEAALVRKDGNEVPIFISACPIMEKGTVVGVLVAVTDISVLKAMELKMVRTARLGALGEMAGGVAHDFNNVLGAILGRVQLLLRQVKAPELVRGLKIIEKAAIDGAGTVKRIQDFTRTRTDEKFIPVNLNELVEDAVSMTRSRWKEDADAEGIVIRVDTNLGDIPPINGNPSELREVLTNLIINAVDALSKGGKISVKTFRENDNIIIVVKDNGVGIQPEVLDKIFDPFFSTKGVSGTGLGLSVSYGIISRHQGEILVESQTDLGSTFTIRLPITQMIKDELAEEKEKGFKPRILKIVVIDDDEMLRSLLADILSYDGHEVLTAASGNEGLKLTFEQNPDVVFTDLGMPHMSGWDVVKAVKDKFPHMPMIMITGWGEQLDKKRLAESKVDAVVAKPFKINQLQQVLNDYVFKGRNK